MDISRHIQTKKIKYPIPSSKKMPSSISMIISNYNHSHMVMRILWQLAHTQRYMPSNFEVIVTDSGSNKENRDIIENMLLCYRMRLNMRYVYVDCSEQRNKDPKFNGYGPCINAAVKNAKYNLICYCDSSILVPPDYLWDLSYPHTESNKRFVRSPLKNANAKQSEEIVKSGSWEDFDKFGQFKQSQGRPSWSVSKKNFINVGGMDESMLYYGSTDDDFVLRLIMNGCDNVMSQSYVLHLFHEEPHRKGDPRNLAIFKEHARNNTKVVNVNKNWGQYTWIK